MTMTIAIATQNKVPNYINGEWMESTAGEWTGVVNPATGEVICQTPLSNAAEVNAAVEAAAAVLTSAASDKGVWQITSPVAGLTTSVHSPAVDSIHSPLM